MKFAVTVLLVSILIGIECVPMPLPAASPNVVAGAVVDPAPYVATRVYAAPAYYSTYWRTYPYAAYGSFNLSI
ncbi:hypothetical protein QE152_g37026 [Popillia japonica]|uniref:Neuropeptide-like 4 n=1 Tax=Popillia japonica TaxID=7064 RepID=A0AAW1IB91_POPJA